MVYNFIVFANLENVQGGIYHKDHHLGLVEHGVVFVEIVTEYNTWVFWIALLLQFVAYYAVPLLWRVSKTKVVKISLFGVF